MLKIKLENRNDAIRYVLTEQERKKLISKGAIELTKSKIQNIEKYDNTNIDFFTDKEVEEDNKVYFNVEKNGILYNCIYDNENEPSNNIEKEIRYFVMWRYTESSNSYIEVIGDYIEGGNRYKREDTVYNDVEEELLNKNKNLIYEELELNENNIEEVKNNLLS